MGNIFVVAACTAGKGRQGRLFMGKIFVVRPPTTKSTNIWPHENYTLYGSFISLPVAMPWFIHHYVAACNGHVRAVEVLIAAKAKVNIKKIVRFMLVC